MGRLIITGAGGFLGSHIVKEVCKSNKFDEVIAITLGAEEMKSRFKGTEGLHIFEADAITTGEVVMKNSDVLLNCAYPRAMKGADITAGLDYIESIFQNVADAHISGIVNISSQSIYDPERDHPALESDTPILTNEYAIGKYCTEMLLRNICRNISYTNIRMASLIGPGLHERVINKMVKSAMEKGIIQYRDNKQLFGYLDVQDAARALRMVAKSNPNNWKPIYNLGSKQSYSLSHIAQIVQEVVHDTTHLDIEITRTSGDEIGSSGIDSEKFISDFGEYQQMSLRDSTFQILLANI